MSVNESPRVNLQEWTVSELSAALKKTVEDAYGYVRVRGELSNVKHHSSGHVYLDLKDERASLAGVIWRTTAQRLKIKPEAGLEVIATGRVTTYPGQSKYQIVIDTLEPAGIGALMALVEERKKKLAAEGLFDEARKQLLPFLPGVIGVVTSPTGAVIRDILHRLADRFPRRVLVWPVRVQGDGSAAEVAAAIHGFNALPEGGPMPRPDVIIVARGGGSIEDLWSFNEEVVVRAAAASMIPLIAAVGHETDFTLIDFAADRRAPTPTAAAEMAVPTRADLLMRLDSLTSRKLAGWQRGQEGRRTEMRAAARALPRADALLAVPRQRLDTAAERLPRALIVAYERRRERFGGIAVRLASGIRANAQAHRAAIKHDRTRVDAIGDRAGRAIDVMLDHRFARLDRAGQLLNALSYRGVLARGFALVRDRDGKPLRLAASVGPGSALEIEFSDGRVRAVVQDSTARAQPAETPFVRRPRRRRASDPNQGSLFGEPADQG